MNNKILHSAIIAVIALAIVVAGYKYLQSPTVTPPENVNTPIKAETEVYKNTEYGFEFTHPADWVPANGDRKVIFNYKTEDGHDVEFMLDDFGPMKMSDEWKKAPTLPIGTEIGYRDGSYHCGDGSTAMNICTGVVQYRTEGMFERGFAFEIHITKVDLNKITGEAQDPATVFPADIKKWDDIMKSFKFINSNTSQAEWATYSNKQIGFEFQYPKAQGYKVTENCRPSIDNTTTCSVSLDNGSSNLIVVVNNPGSGWFSVNGNAEKGSLNVDGIKTSYQYGQASNEGGPIPETWAYLTQFTKANNEFAVAYLYSEAHPGVFREQVIDPVIASFKFTK